MTRAHPRRGAGSPRLGGQSVGRVTPGLGTIGSTVNRRPANDNSAPLASAGCAPAMTAPPRLRAATFAPQKRASLAICEIQQALFPWR